MPTITIDGRPVDAEDGMTIFEAARRQGIRIPALCRAEGCESQTSCMVCVVRINGKSKFEPSCATRVVDGMAVESETEEVRAARRTALELLLSEHVGDCEAPCRRACPAHMDIPRMIRQIAAGDPRGALVTVKQAIALPAVLGRICPAPCEKACRRAGHDGAVSICLLKRFVADEDLAAGVSWKPPCQPTSGKNVAIVGAGPAGLAAAFHLLQDGHACTIFDEHEKPGGMLRYGVSPMNLPEDVLDAEIGRIRELGAQFRPGVVVGKSLSMEDLRRGFDAVVLAPGAVDAARAAGFGVGMAERGIQVEHGSHLTSRDGVFAGGDAVLPARLAIRSVAHGKAMAVAVGQYLRHQPVTGLRLRFDSRLGALMHGEMEEFLKSADRAARREPPEKGQGLAATAAEVEARRCLRCDCRKGDACRLRDAADQVVCSSRRFAGPQRRAFRRILEHPGVVYEPGKCIKCGLCVQVTAGADERLGLAVLGRGFDTEIGVPFGESLDHALEVSARRCVDICPTGALAWRDA